MHTIMIAPEHIAFDIDGVFADTPGLFLEIARTEYGINHIRYKDITKYFLEECLDINPDVIGEILNKIVEGDFQAELKPVEGAVEVLSEVGRVGPLLFVTARSKVSPIRTWVHEMLAPLRSDIKVVATGTFDKKAEVLKEHDIQYFVDDCLDVCFTLHEHGITPIVLAQPWNREPHPFREVNTWAEIKGLIDFPSLHF